MLTKRLAALGLAAALALPMAAACSKSSESSTSNTSASSTTTAKSGGSSSGGTTAGGGSSSGGSSSGTPSSADCLKAAGQFTSLIGKSTAALAPGQSVDAAELQAEVDQLKGSVPADLQKDMQTWSDAFTQYINNIKDLNLSDPSSFTNPATMQKIQDASKPIESSDFKTAENNIQAYFNKCQATP
ncbi:MAG: hypothetical protein U0Q07_19190 [Acidimicrobiales bacterium]